jgi:hypothetical protein
MTTSSEDSVKLEAKTITPPRHSHHKSRRRKRIAAGILLILAFVVGVLAVSDFALNAYEKASVLDVISVVDENGRRVARDGGSNFSDAYLSHFERLQQLDATAVVLAAAFLITSTVISRRIRRHRR